MKRTLALIVASMLAALVLGVSPATAASWLIPPVDAVIARRFEPPGTTWGPGHRGIDYAVPPGTAVRAIGAGTVVFAGRVADTVAVTIAHGDGMESTYSDLDEVLVAPGDVVDQGYWIGRTGSSHDGGQPGLHLGLKVEGAYVDPEAFIGPIGLGRAIRLAPLVWEPPETLPAVFRTPLLSATAPPDCDAEPRLSATPPNGNIAVLVAGIGSKTAGGISAALYDAGGSLLGYPEAVTYPFSYRGSGGNSLHEPYEPADTFGDIKAAGERLRELLERVAERYPGRSVDLIAHSQGGIVARSYLQLAAEAWDPALPRVDHLVTFSTPHGGAPLAAGRAVLDETTGGRALLRAGSWWASHGGPVPDPYATSVAQLAPGSDLLRRLDREAVLYGTKVLSLAIANDVVVPADHARWQDYGSSVVAPEGVNGHDAVVTSSSALAIAQGFLRDAPPACRTAWDLWGPRVGRAVSLAERAVPWLYRVLEP